ncbi:MAG: phage tail tape measure protein, partial [Mixta calida]|nr:phage tail tape measure protein [Mixta calida]
RINEMFKDPTPPKTKAYRDDAGQRMLLELQQQQAALEAQQSTGYKISAQQEALIKWEQQLADIKNKQTLTADQKSLLANSDLITAQLQQNAALERQIETREKLLALDKARADITRTITNRQSQYATDELFAGGGLSQYEQQQYTQRLSLEQSYNDKITQLRQQRASATSDIAREEIDQEIQLQQQALQTELSNYDAHIQRMNEARGSFTAGASRAWQEYQDSATNVSAMSEQLFTNAFTGMEDSLVSFVTTGKASFSDFANSVLSDIARIAARQALVGLGTSIFSAAGGMFSGGAAASASASSSNAFSSGAYNNLSLNAKGGVYDSPSLSAYSGGIYDSPKFFAFAKGAGVFGEAGPEAIMPLKRGPDGSLGVQLHSGGQASGGSVGDIIIQQTIHVSGNGDAALQRAMEEAARKGANDGAKRARQDMLQDFQNRGQARRLLGV